MNYGPGDNPTATGTVAQVGSVISRVAELELAATNLCLQSADFATTWATTGAIAITPNTTAAPNGATEGDTLNDNGATTGEVQQNIAVANDTVSRTFSVYLSPGTSGQTRVGVRLTGGVAKDAYIDVNPANGAALTSSADAAAVGVEAFTIGGVAWYRVHVTVANNASGNTTAQPYIQPRSDGAAGTGTVIAWGAQFELGSPSSLTQPAPTSPIPTTTVAVTRTAGKIPSWLLNVQAASYSMRAFTGNGTYNAPAGLVAALVIVVGGGGGGGAATDGGTQSAAAGGGGGGWAIELLQAATIGASQSVTVGSGGGSAAAGNTSSFGALLSATGGAAGASSGSGVAAQSSAAGGVGSGGDVSGAGDPGGAAMYNALGTPSFSGCGGGSFFGGGAAGRNTTGTGNNGAAPGAGGSGGWRSSAGTNNGGSGATGVVYVVEFKA